MQRVMRILSFIYLLSWLFLCSNNKPLCLFSGIFVHLLIRYQLHVSFLFYVSLANKTSQCCYQGGVNTDFRNRHEEARRELENIRRLEIALNDSLKMRKRKSKFKF
mmetsp:Transcript_32064/g.44721  ORF Transcript_32064/g.44721 Transcript_32064/m.44721 type:complete len:106 (+) Transcript_32064:655-972(+)